MDGNNNNTNNGVELLVLTVHGMTCGSCVKTVHTSLTALGVDACTVSLATKTVTLQYDTAKITEANVRECIEDVGYTVMDRMEASVSRVSSVEPSMYLNEIVNSVHEFQESKTGVNEYKDAMTRRQDVRECKSQLQEAAIDGNTNIVKVRLNIRGMSCAACVATLENAFEYRPGVLDASISLLLERGDIVYDQTMITVDEILETLIDIGFDGDVAVTPTNKLADMTVHIDGMTCSSCVSSVERHVSDIKGVKSVAVNLLQENAKIVYDSTVVGARAIVNGIGEIGYDAKIEAAGRSNADKAVEMREARKRTIKFYRNMLLLSMLFSLPALIITMVLSNIPSVKKRMMRRITGNFTQMDLILWILVTPVQFGIGSIFYKSAYNGLKHGYANMYVLISIGTISAYTFATQSVIRALFQAPTQHKEEGAHHFETASTLITFVLLGRYLEAIAKGRTSAALSKLLSIQASTAILLEYDGDGKIIGESEVSLDLLQKGDIVKVIRGAKVPADGTVVFGASCVDEAMITGESVPVLKSVDSTVIGSTVNQDGLLHVRVEKLGEDSTLSNILRLMEDAQSSKAPIQQFADRLSSVFVPLVVVLSICTFIIWFTLASTDSIPDDWQQDDEGDFLFAFLFAIAVMVIACPCALGLATPTAVMVGTGIGAELGVLIKGGEALETANTVTAFIFDKTGTLTRGKPRVTSMKVLRSSTDAKHIIWLAACAEQNSEHVLGKAIVECANAMNVDAYVQPSEFDAVAGRGLQCMVNDTSVIIGNRKWMEKHNIAISRFAELNLSGYEHRGQTALCIGVDGVLEAVMGLADTPKPEARCVIRRLHELDIEVWMCTGDNEKTARVVGEQLYITNIVAGVLPAGKYDLVKELQTKGHKVAMIGDGINDSPALAQADLGLSVGAGTDVAMEAASIVLVKNHLWDVITALDLSHATFNRIRWNFVWAMGYNVLGIPIAAGVMFPLLREKLPPQLAGLAMALSSVSVILSSLYLKLYKPPPMPSDDEDDDVARKQGSARKQGGDGDDDIELVDTKQHCCGCGDCACCDRDVPIESALINVADGCSCGCDECQCNS